MSPWGGQADPAAALPAFEHGIVANADRTQLQHILVPSLTIH